MDNLLLKFSFTCGGHFILSKKCCSTYVARCNNAVGFNYQGNSGGSGVYGVKGKKVIIQTVTVSELSCQVKAM